MSDTDHENQGERGPLKAAAFQRLATVGSIGQDEPFLASALRNATGDQNDVAGSEFGESIAALGALVAVMRVTGNLIDDDALEALIVRVAELLGEPLPLASGY